MKDKESRSRSRFFGGVVALTLGNLFVKVVGLVLKIPLHGILGDAGMVYYNNAYDIYAWLFTIATTVCRRRYRCSFQRTGFTAISER